jgi:hypothetical protein
MQITCLVVHGMGQRYVVLPQDLCSYAPYTIVHSSAWNYVYSFCTQLFTNLYPCTQAPRNSVVIEFNTFSRKYFRRYNRDINVMYSAPLATYLLKKVTGDSRRVSKTFLASSVQIAHLMVAGTVLLGVKRSGREADYLPPPAAEVKSGTIPTLLHIVSWSLCMCVCDCRQ